MALPDVCSAIVVLLSSAENSMLVKNCWKVEVGRCLIIVYVHGICSLTVDESVS